MRITVVSLFGFSFLVWTSAVASLIFNENDVVRIAMTIVVVGGIGLWSFVSGLLIFKNHGLGLVSAGGMTATLSAIVFVGRLQSGSFQVDDAIHPLLNSLRTACGMYLLVLWVVLFRAAFIRLWKSSFPSANDRGRDGLR